MKTNMKSLSKLFLFCVLAVVFSSCSIKQMAYNSIANGMAPLPEAKAKSKPDPDAPNPITALTGEDDIELVGEVFPVILKTYEAMHIQDPKHRGLALMTGELYIMYANIFVETPATYISDAEYDKKNMQLFRAKKFYKRGAKMALSSLDMAYPGFKDAIYSNDIEKIKKALDRCKKYDAEALHWSGAGILATFALDPLDIDSLQAVLGGVSMIEKAVELEPEFMGGSSWEILCKFYAGAPVNFGGGIEKAKKAYKKALEISKGKTPSVYLTYATSFCVPTQDSKGYDEAIEKALAIDPELQPENKLTIKLAQDYAKWLQEHKEEFILE